MDQNHAETNPFDMGSLQNNLPQSNRGLSRYYSGKARSFTCMADVRCVEDLKKQEHPDAKKRKLKYLNRSKVDIQSLLPPHPCRRVSSSNQCAAPYVH